MSIFNRLREKWNTPKPFWMESAEFWDRHGDKEHAERCRRAAIIYARGDMIAEAGLVLVAIMLMLSVAHV